MYFYPCEYKSANWIEQKHTHTAAVVKCRKRVIDLSVGAHTHTRTYIYMSRPSAFLRALSFYRDLVSAVNEINPF